MNIEKYTYRMLRLMHQATCFQDIFHMKNEREVNEMKKKTLSRFLAAALVGIMLVGCGAQGEQNVDTESNSTENSVSESITPEVVGELTYPVDTDVELRLYSMGIPLSSAYMDATESPFHTGLSENTGIKIKWEYEAAGADANTAYNLMLQEDELPHIIFTAGNATVANGTQLLADGLIYDLTEYLPTYAPDYWEYINRPENEETLRSLKTDAGQLFCFPFLRESTYNITYLGPAIRQDWLDECGLDAPVTLEDWENVLVTFKEKYNARLGFVLGRFNIGGGFASGTDAHAALKLDWYVDDNGKVQCANAQPEWKALLEVLNRWYEMDLIDPDFTTADDASIRTKVLNNEIGACFTAMSQVTNYIADAEAENTGAKWVGIGYARTAEGEPTSCINTARTLWNAGYGAMITTSCNEEELIAALQFLNYGYSEEGMMYWNYGTEGVSYTLDADGNAQFTELVTADELGINEAFRKYTGVATSGIAVQLEGFVKAKNNPVSAEAVYKWIENTDADKYVLPGLAFSEEDTITYNDITNAMNTFVAEEALKFVTGDRSLDEFDKFVSQLEGLGMNDVLEIIQGAYDRYLEK